MARGTSNVPSNGTLCFRSPIWSPPGQVKLGDFIRVDLDAEGRITFIKEAEGAMVPMLMERYGAAAGAPTLVARAARPVARREFGATPASDTK